jgi:preprotein translocase subunit YajC
MIRKSVIVLAAAGLAAAAVPAAAQQAAVSAGTVVKDTSGATVGTVIKVDGDAYIVKTDKHEVRLPATSFTAAEGSLLFGMTQAQLNDAVDQAKAQADAKIAAGAAVTDASGGAVGTIESVDAQFVTLKLASGTAVRLPRTALAAGPNGVVSGATAAELEAAAKGAGAGAEQAKSE